MQTKWDWERLSSCLHSFLETTKLLSLCRRHHHHNKQQPSDGESKNRNANSRKQTWRIRSVKNARKSNSLMACTGNQRSDDEAQPFTTHYARADTQPQRSPRTTSLAQPAATSSTDAASTSRLAKVLLNSTSPVAAASPNEWTVRPPRSQTCPRARHLSSCHHPFDPSGSTRCSDTCTS